MLACSGGADSVALFYLLKANNVYFEVAHVNYHLRGEDSINDELFVQQLCAENEIIFHVHHANMESNINGIQEKARNIRYDFFNKLLIERALDFICTAHHANDAAENLLFRFVRGTGLKGLVGFQTKLGSRFKPMLQFTKEEIAHYLQKHHYNHRTDLSNASNKYTRNKIRNLMFPMLEEDLPQIEKRLLHTQQNLKHDWDLLQFFVNEYKENLKKGTFSLNCNEQKTHLPSFWYYLLLDFQINFEQAQQIANACQQVKNGFELQIEENQIFILKNQINVTIGNERKDFGKELLIHNQHIENIEISKDLNISTTILHEIPAVFENKRLYFNLANLSFPLKIRNYKNGDKFVPFGLNGHKLLSDFYNDLGIHAAAKQQQFVLIDAQENIIAALPYRIANQVRAMANEPIWVLTCNFE